jgi:class 3 adenylate cyclase
MGVAPRYAVAHAAAPECGIAMTVVACPRCRHENRESAGFCGQCGAALATHRACPRCATNNPPGHRFCDGCGTALGPRPANPPPALATPSHLAAKILASRGALAGERKLVTVLFADVVHSMALTEDIDAEEWHRVLDRFFQIVAGAIHRFEGTVNQFTGDGVMALFGAPIAHEDHAARACHAALDLGAGLGEYASELARRGLAFAVRLGLNSGEVVLGHIGDDLRMEYTALGHTVGLAARIQQMAAPGTVYLTEHTARLVDGLFELVDRGTPSMRGVSTPVRVYELVGTGALRTRLDVSRRRGFSRLVGREAELARLWRVLEAAVAGDAQVVGLVGDAGVGKSRICHEFVERCRAQGIAVHEAHCPTHGATVPLLPVRELVRSCLALDADGSDVGPAIRRALGADDPEACALVLDLLGMPGDAPTPTGADRTARLAALVARVVRALAGAEPIVVLLDDVHWLDAASEAVLRALVRATTDVPVLVVANFRPEHDPAWMTDGRAHRLALEPLGPEATHALVTELLGDELATGALADLIEERTGGNPFFVEEVVHALAAAGSLAGRRGAYRLAARLETLAIPATVQALLNARIDRLGDEPKQVLGTAAVIGKQFDEPLLAAVVGCDAQRLATTLATLEEADLVHAVPGHAGPRWAFRHPLTQEVAYTAQLGDHRARLHGAVAGALETLMADRLGEHAALIAHHWRAAGMRYEAERWERRAALRVSSIRVGGRGRLR